MSLQDDCGLLGVLASFGVSPGARLGQGGEAAVFALDERRVVRILHPGGSADDIRRRQRLVTELSRATTAGFELPEVLEIGEIDGRWFAIERRLKGRSVLEELRQAEGARRRRLIAAHLQTAASLGELHLDPRDYFGDLLSPEPVREETWHGFLTAKAASSLRRAGPEFERVDAETLSEPLPDMGGAAFVHLDAGAGNMLTDGERITAVIDIGMSSVAGDRRLDPIAAAVYLTSSQITPSATADDAHVARSWLRSAGLDDWFEPVQRWLAAYWAFAVEDLPLQKWCRMVLLSR